MNENDIININTANNNEVTVDTREINRAVNTEAIEVTPASEPKIADINIVLEPAGPETSIEREAEPAASEMNSSQETVIPEMNASQDNAVSDPYNKYISPEYVSQAEPVYNPVPADRYRYYEETDMSRKLSRDNLINSIYSDGSDVETVKGKKKGPGFFTVLAMSAAFGLIAALVFIGVTKFYLSKNPELLSSKNDATPVQLTTGDASNTKLNLIPATGTTVSSTGTADISSEDIKNRVSVSDVPDIVEKTLPSIVSIECVSRIYNSYYGSYSSSSAGSGIIIRKTDKELNIATNNHVVDGVTEISVVFCDGTKASATVKGTDEDVDVAVISVKLSDLSEETLNAISVATLGDSDAMRMGELAIVLGNSLGYGPTVTVGYLSAKDRSLTVDGKTYSGLLQTDAAINPGNSGGALVNIKGEVIGINNGKVGGTAVEGVGYAIPISKVNAILNDFMSREILTTEEQGFLGVVLENVTETEAQIYGWPIGAYISSVVEGTAAEEADIRVSDIITGLDETAIKDREALIEKIKSIRYGTEVTVTLQRLEDGEFVEKKIKVVLGKRPTNTN